MAYILKVTAQPRAAGELRPPGAQRRGARRGPAASSALPSLPGVGFLFVPLAKASGWETMQCALGTDSLPTLLPAGACLERAGEGARAGVPNDGYGRRSRGCSELCGQGSPRPVGGHRLKRSSRAWVRGTAFGKRRRGFGKRAAFAPGNTKTSGATGSPGGMSFLGN